MDFDYYNRRFLFRCKCFDSFCSLYWIKYLWKLFFIYHIQNLLFYVYDELSHFFKKYCIISIYFLILREYSWKYFPKISWIQTLFQFFFFPLAQNAFCRFLFLIYFQSICSIFPHKFLSTLKIYVRDFYFLSENATKSLLSKPLYSIFKF